MKKIYTSIDIGSDTIKFVVGEYFNNKINILSSYIIKSKGVRKGLIVDANLTDASVKFIDPDDFFAIPGINSATYNGKKFKTVFKETISKDFDDPIKTYTKKINAAIVKASE